MKLRKVNDEVLIAEGPIVRIGAEEIGVLKRQAAESPRRRARICAHPTNDDALHEMIIAISASSYIHPHKHLGKSESFHIVEGEVDVAVFDENGNLVDVVELGGAGSGRRFFYRLSSAAYHTLVIRSDFLIVHEVTNGPFDRAKTVLAPFAPAEEDGAAARAYMVRLADRVARHRIEGIQ